MTKILVDREVLVQVLDDAKAIAKIVFKSSCNHTHDAIEFMHSELSVNFRALLAHQAAVIEACAAEIEKLKTKVAERSAAHLAAHVDYDKGYTEGRLDAVEAFAEIATDAIAFNGGSVQMEAHVRQAIRSLLDAPSEPQEAFCYCNKDVSLQMVSGGGAPEGYLGKVTLRIGDQYREYHSHPDAPSEPMRDYQTHYYTKEKL